MVRSQQPPRRYLSVPAGSYPPPVSPAVGLAEPAVAKEVPAPPVQPAPAPAAAPAPEIAAAAAAAAGTVAIAGLAPQATESPAGAPASRRGMLWGALVGGVFGFAAALVLLVLSSGDSDFGLLSRPLELWQSVEDPLVKASAVLVALGFVLLGTGIGGRSAGER